MRLHSLPLFLIAPGLLLLLAWHTAWAPGLSLVMAGAFLPLYKPRDA